MSLEHRLHDRCACGSSMSSWEGGAAWRPFVLSGTRRVYERSRPFTIRHIALDLALDVGKKTVSGTACLRVGRVDPEAKELVLDAVGFEIERVEIKPEGSDGGRKNGRRAKGSGGWQKAAHTYDGESLRVTMPPRLREAEVRIRYEAAPRRGLYFLEPDEHVKDRPRQVWTQCQDEDARYVFPCHDKPHVKQTTELKVRVPPGWRALSNGALVSTDEAHRNGTFHYRMDKPHPSYLVTLVAGEFSILEDDADGIPLAYYVPKGREADGKRTFARTPEMIRRFSELLGVPYPWDRYTQVVVSDFIFGGMENTTATTMYEHILLDERAAIDITSDDLVAHELAHQWFGDFVTCRDWSHAWLNEGFATFMEHVDREGHLGRDEYDYGLKNDMDAYFAEAKGRYRRPIVCQDYEAPIDIFDRHLYEKGGLVLHMLRRELGDESFWRGVRRYLEKHAHGVVETRDLERALEETSGKSLERFFEQWVYRPGHPELEVKIAHEDGVLEVTVRQTQQTAQNDGAHSAMPDGGTPVFAFDFVIDVGHAGKAGVTRFVRHVDQKSHTFAFKVAERPSFVVVDPELAVLADVKLEAPADLLRAQLESAPTSRGRMLAAEALARHDDPATTKALGARLADEREFWGVRAEAAEALGNLRSQAAFDILASHVRTKHPKVRRAVVHALGRFRTSKAAEVLKPLALSDPSYLVEAEAARSLGATRQSTAFDTLLEVVDRPSWGDVIRQGAIDGLANLRDDRAVPHVLARTKYGVSTRGRRAAILALPKLSGDRRTRETLEELLDSSDPYLRVDVVRALADLGDAKSRGALQRQLERDLDGRVRRRIREALRDLGSAGKREADRLRDELEAVRNEQQQLRARLGKLESMLGVGNGEPRTRAPNGHKEAAAKPRPAERKANGARLRR